MCCDSVRESKWVREGEEGVSRIVYVYTYDNQIL